MKNMTIERFKTWLEKHYPDTYNSLSEGGVIDWIESYWLFSSVLIEADEIVSVIAVSDIFQRCDTGGCDTDAAALPLVRNDSANLIVA